MEELPDPVPLTECRQAGLAEVAIGDVPDIMPECDRLDQILVEAEGSPDRPGDPRDQLDMDHPVGDMVVLHEIEDLGLVDIPGIGPGVDDTVCIP